MHCAWSAAFTPLQRPNGNPSEPVSRAVTADDEAAKARVPYSLPRAPVGDPPTGTREAKFDPKAKKHSDLSIAVLVVGEHRFTAGYT
ncbi:MAG: hypothetical protein DME26_03450 [Verrucomicrobia bacterium]|nr:MAG: hypothetical protein DME26_03450 [Verrucomicrobiota bacterium]